MQDSAGNLHWLLNIPRDGNCLFGALTHQRHGVTPSNPLFDAYNTSLRKLAVRHIRTHLEQFNHHLEAFAAELVEGEIPIQDKVGVYLDRLETSGYWGGEECLTAISNLFAVRIDVHQTNGTISIVPDIEPTAVYRIFYRGSTQHRNHYDSIICVRPAAMPQNHSDYIAIRASSRTFYAQNPGQEETTQIQSVLQQITGSVPSPTEVNILRWLIAEDIEKRPASFLTNCGIHELEQDNYTLRMRLGRIDGGPATYISLAALLKVRIFSHSIDGSALRYDPAQGGHLSFAHILEDKSTIPYRYLSINFIEEPESLQPDPYDIAQAVHQNETHSSPKPVPEVITIEETTGLRFATLNVNGCRLPAKRNAIDLYLSLNRIHVAALQEVNLCCSRTSTEHYQWHLGKTRGNQRRGLAVLIRKGARINVTAIDGGGPNVQMLEMSYEVLIN